MPREVRAARMAPATLERMLRRRDAAEGASRSFLLEIFLISGAALLLEVSYTRIISFKLYYYYTYLTIGLALLGLGSGAVFMAVSGRLRADPDRRAPPLVHPGGGGRGRRRLRRRGQDAARHARAVGGGPAEASGEPGRARADLSRPVRQLPAHRRRGRRAVRPPARAHQPPVLLRPRRRCARVPDRRAAHGLGRPRLGRGRRRRGPARRGPSPRRRRPPPRSDRRGRRHGRDGRRGRAAQPGPDDPHRGDQAAADRPDRRSRAGAPCSASTPCGSRTTSSSTTTGCGARRSGRGTATRPRSPTSTTRTGRSPSPRSARRPSVC